MKILSRTFALLAMAAVSQVQAQEKLDIVTHDFPPYSIEGPNGVLQGSYVELVQRVCQKAGLNCSIRQLPFRRATAELAEGLAMGHFPLGWNKERMERMHFSVPLQYLEYGFFVRQGSPLAAPWHKSLAGKTVGVVGPSNTEKMLKEVLAEQEAAKIPALTIQLFATEAGQGARMVSEGRLDANFGNRDTTNYFANKLEVKNLTYGGKVFDGLYVIGFNKEKTPIAAIEKFNRAAIELMKANGFAEILKRWDAKSPTVDLAAWEKMGMPR